MEGQSWKIYHLKPIPVDENEDCQEQPTLSKSSPSKSAPAELMGPKMLKSIVSLLDEYRNAKFSLPPGAQVSLNRRFLELQYPGGLKLLSSQSQDPSEISAFSIYDVLRLLSYAADKERYLIFSGGKVLEEEHRFLSESVKNSFQLVQDILLFNTGIDISKVDEMNIPRSEKRISTESLKKNIQGESSSQQDIKSSSDQKSETQIFNIGGTVAEEIQFDSQNSGAWKWKLKKRTDELYSHIKLLFSQDMEKRVHGSEEQLLCETRMPNRKMEFAPTTSAQTLPGRESPNVREFIQSQRMLYDELPDSEPLDALEGLRMYSVKLYDRMQLFDQIPWKEFFETASHDFEASSGHLQGLSSYIFKGIAEQIENDEKSIIFQFSKDSLCFGEIDEAVDQECYQESFDLCSNAHTNVILNRLLQLPGEIGETLLAEQIPIFSETAFSLLSRIIFAVNMIESTSNKYRSIIANIHDTFTSLDIDPEFTISETTAAEVMQKAFVLKTIRFLNKENSAVSKKVPKTLCNTLEQLIKCNSYLEQHFNALKEDLLLYLMNNAADAITKGIACICHISKTILKTLLTYKQWESLEYSSHFTQVEKPSMVTTLGFQKEVGHTTLGERDSHEVSATTFDLIRNIFHASDVPILKKLVECGSLVIYSHLKVYSDFSDTRMICNFLLTEISYYFQELRETAKRYE